MYISSCPCNSLIVWGESFFYLQNTHSILESRIEMFERRKENERKEDPLQNLP